VDDDLVIPGFLEDESTTNHPQERTPVISQ